MSQMPGNESVKRCIEIAATGDHNILIFAAFELHPTLRNYTKEFLTKKQTYLTAPCYCGYYGDYTRECKCTTFQVMHVHSKIKKKLDRYPIICEATRVEASKIVTNFAEPIAVIKKRIKEGKARLPDVPRKIDPAALELLEQAVKHYSLYPQHVENIKVVARTVLALSSYDSDIIKSEHIAEAIVIVADSIKKLF